MNKQKIKNLLLDQLYKDYIYCIACPLAFEGRSQVVFHKGNSNAKIVFIGEAPGKEEDSTGRPFVGRSGKLLDTIFHSLNILESEVFITNIVKCRPKNNRPPTDLESYTCATNLLVKQLAIIQPKAICTLGTSATKHFILIKKNFSSIRGQLYTTHNALVMPTFHPAYILRNRNKLSIFTEDIKKIFSIAHK